MIIVKPDINNETNEIKTLNAILDGSPCGFIRFKLTGYIIVITEMFPISGGELSSDNPDYVILDTIIRALGSWGLNHSCFYIECAVPVLYPTLEALRFSMKDGVMKSDLSKILDRCSDR